LIDTVLVPAVTPVLLFPVALWLGRAPWQPGLSARGHLAFLMVLAIALRGLVGAAIDWFRPERLAGEVARDHLMPLVFEIALFLMMAVWMVIRHCKLGRENTQEALREKYIQRYLGKHA